MRSSAREAASQGPPEREADLLRRALALLTERLPSGWSARVVEELSHDRRVDTAFELAAPDGGLVTFLVEAKRSVVTRDLPGIVDQLRSYGQEHAGEAAAPLLAVRYLGPSARAWLEERGVSYVDSTGNMHVVHERPALFLHDRGAEQDPWRGPGRPTGTLAGRPAARVVRALVDFAPPMTMLDLVRRSGATTGPTYRVVKILEEEALVVRDARGPITSVDWRRLLDRWSEDYGFQRTNRVGAYLFPRGLPALLEALAGSSALRYALTGSLAAQRLEPYAPARTAMVYVDDPQRVAGQLNLRPVDSGANVLLATAEYDVVFERTVYDDGLIYTAPSQTAVDLLTGPGRNPAEGQALLDWMERHESAWRQ